MTLDQGAGGVLLQFVLWLPLVGAIAVALFGGGDNPRRPWAIALGFALVTFILAAWLLAGFNRSDLAIGTYQFERAFDWLPVIGSRYDIAVDGLAMPLVALNALLSLSAVAGSWRITLRPQLYFSLFLVLETAVMGVFTATDLFLFFLFWELELIPMFLIIGIWGGGRREYASFKFLLFTVGGSAFMLVGIFLLNFFGPHSFSMSQVAGFDYLGNYGSAFVAFVFGLLFVGFAVKVPIFPLHTWLPDAHVEAPTAGSVMLAGVLLKMGGYGILRLCVSLMPAGAHEWQGVLVVLAVINAVYGAYLALSQTDLKKMIANSSISHMGFVILGISALTAVGFQGAVLVMIAHGLYSGLLFSMVGLLYERTHTRDVTEMSGLAQRMPFVSAFFFFAGFASLGLPGLAGFVAEFTTFIGAYAVWPFATMLCVASIAITAGYILWRLGTVFYGPLMERWATLDDAIGKERFAVGLLAVGTLVIGVLPNIVGEISAGGVAPIAQAVARIATR